jgi:hypothetical protein
MVVIWFLWLGAHGFGRSNTGSHGVLRQEPEERMKRREGEDGWLGYGFVEQASEEWARGGCSWRGRGAAAGPHRCVSATV